MRLAFRYPLGSRSSYWGGPGRGKILTAKAVSKSCDACYMCVGSLITIEVQCEDTTK